jgi:hypothetical protein
MTTDSYGPATGCARLSIRADRAEADLGLAILTARVRRVVTALLPGHSRSHGYELTAHSRTTGIAHTPPRDCPTRVAALRDRRQCRPAHAARAKRRQRDRELRQPQNDEISREAGQWRGCITPQAVARAPWPLPLEGRSADERSGFASRTGVSFDVRHASKSLRMTGGLGSARTPARPAPLLALSSGS